MDGALASGHHLPMVQSTSPPLGACASEADHGESDGEDSTDSNTQSHSSAESDGGSTSQSGNHSEDDEEAEDDHDDDDDLDSDSGGSTAIDDDGSVVASDSSADARGRYSVLSTADWAGELFHSSNSTSRRSGIGSNSSGGVVIDAITRGGRNDATDSNDSTAAADDDANDDDWDMVAFEDLFTQPRDGGSARATVGYDAGTGAGADEEGSRDDGASAGGEDVLDHANGGSRGKSCRTRLRSTFFVFLLFLFVAFAVSKN